MKLDSANREFGVRDIDIHDSSFTVNKQRIIEITDDIKRRKLDVHFMVRTRVDCVNEDILIPRDSVGLALFFQPPEQVWGLTEIGFVFSNGYP